MVEYYSSTIAVGRRGQGGDGDGGGGGLYGEDEQSARLIMFD